MANFMPTTSYVPWRPNKDVIKFFDDMSKRRIADTNKSTIKITNTSVPKTDEYGGKYHTAIAAPKQSKKKTPRKKCGISQSIVTTAKSQLALQKGKTLKKSGTRSSTADDSGTSALRKKKNWTRKVRA